MRALLKTETIAFRVAPEDRAEILLRASEAGLTLTQFLTDSALNRLTASGEAVDEQLEQIKDRLSRLETLAFGTE